MQQLNTSISSELQAIATRLENAGQDPTALQQITADVRAAAQRIDDETAALNAGNG